jgi:hypothetical protein
MHLTHSEPQQKFSQDFLHKDVTPIIRTSDLAADICTYFAGDFLHPPIQERSQLTVFCVHDAAWNISLKATWKK